MSFVIDIFIIIVGTRQPVLAMTTGESTARPRLKKM